MPHLGSLRFEILRIMRIRLRANRDLLHHLQSIAFQAYDLFRIIGQETKLTYAKIEQDLCSKAVIAEIRRKPKSGVGFHGVQPFFLYLISVNFRRQPDTSSL